MQVSMEAFAQLKLFRFEVAGTKYRRHYKIMCILKARRIRFLEYFSHF